MDPQISQVGMTTQFSQQAGAAPQSEFHWNAGVEPADAHHFENALSGQPASPMDASSSLAAHPTSNATLGEAILGQLESLKHSTDAMQAEIFETLGKENLQPSDMLMVQYQLMSVNIELQTTSNMAHHGVEDVKTIMRGQ